MRPTKLTSALLDAFRAVLADELAAIVFTEEELVWQANQHLPLAEQITYRTFQRYKAEIMESETQDARHKTQDLRSESEYCNEEEQKADAENTELVRQMYITLKSALFKQKRALVNGVMEGQTNWRRYSWMLERKFPDFRLKPLPTANPKPIEDGMPDNDIPTIPQAQPKPVATEPELTELEQMSQKWRSNMPWAPMYADSSRSIDADELYKIEDELALDEAATGYQNPYAHHGYLPDERRKGGFYVFTGMGLDKLCHRRYIGPEDSRLALTKQVIALQWEEQERERQQALANQQDHAAEVQHRQLEARMAARKDAMDGKCFYEPDRT